MIQYFKKLNNQKGASILQLVASLAMISVVVGGVSVGAVELINGAKDIQRAANLRQLATALELYYFDNQSYPRVAGDNSEGRFSDLLSQLDNYLASFPTEKENYDYQDSNSSQNYILKTILENSGEDFDNPNCSEPYYCIKM